MNSAVERGGFPGQCGHVGRVVPGWTVEHYLLLFRVKDAADERLLQIVKFHPVNASL